MPSESQILQSFDQEDPETDQSTDAATDAQEESVGITPDDHNTTELDDGGAIIKLRDDKDVRESLEFYSNLAEEMEDSDLRDIAVKLLDLIEEDKTAREKRDKQYEDGLKRTGLANDAPGGASFEGASRATHPLMLEVNIDFAARAIKELWPADGPVKSSIVGTPTDKKEQKGKRKAAYMNYVMTKKMRSMRYEMEQILTQVPFGVAYSKMYQDQRRKRPCHEPVWMDEILLPWAATDYYSSPRKTHVQSLDQYTFDDRVRSGMYRETRLSALVIEPDQTRADKQNDKIEGKSTTQQNEDGLRTVYECAVQYLIPDPKRKGSQDDDSSVGPAPYLISIDLSTREVLSVYRNWDQDDENETELDHVVAWPFLPWRGAMPIGTPQILGGIAAAATGALRALLDSAHLNNFPGGVRIKSGPMGGQSVRIDPAQTNELQDSGLLDDVRKVYMPTPVTPTSPVLFELLGYLVDAGKEIVKTTLDEANDNANVPVGTTMARMEQGMVVFSAIHSRLHNSMGRLLSILHRLLGTYLEDAQVLKETGEQMCFKADFDKPDDVIPVSDPEIFSELQRIAQIQTVAQRAQLYPQLYDQYKVEKAILSMMKIKDATQYLNPKPVPQPQHAINENIAAALGQPIVAFPDQDHWAHIQCHLSFLEDPMFGQNPLMAPQAIPAILQNVKEHMLFAYGVTIHDLASKAAGKDITEFMSIKDAKVKTAFDQMLAAASQQAHPKFQSMFAQIPGVIQTLQATLQKFQPPPPMDPSQVASKKVDADAQAKQADTAVKQQQVQNQAQVDAQTLALKKAEQDQNMQLSTGEQQVKQAQTQADTQTKVATTQATNQSREKIAAGSDQTKLTTTQEDNNTAMEIAAAEIEAGKHTQIKDGQGVGGKPRVS